MTSFPVVGDILLSPLHEKLLTLSRNKKVFAKIDKYDHQKVRSSSVEFSGAVSLRKKDVTKFASHKPDQPRMAHTKKQFFEGKKKLTKRGPGLKELTFGDERSVSPFIIEEDCICCDKCEKWRLLPYGTKPEQLSESWVCSMLNWLPGMNRCDVSEEDTTRALHALYKIIVLNSLQNHADSGSIDVKTHNGRESSVKKRKLRDHLDDSDANAFEREVGGEGGFRKQKKSKVYRSEKKGVQYKQGC